MGNVALTENKDVQVSTNFQKQDLNCDNVDDLELQLEHNLAALFLRMWTILNISENAIQDVIQQINQITDLCFLCNSENIPQILS